MTTPEDILRAGLEDAMSAFGLLENTLREFKQEPLAEIVMQFKNRATAALARAERATKE